MTNRTAKIELSTKVCDSYGNYTRRTLACFLFGYSAVLISNIDRIKETLIHELCHAATWIVDGVRKAGHGKVWRAW